jgi:hypothetical protein
LIQQKVSKLSMDESDMLSNQKLVQFKKASVKMICSKDSGTILSQDDPIVPLSTSDTEKARLTFQTFLQQTEETLTTVDKGMLYDLLVSGDFISKTFDKEMVENVIERYYNGISPFI